MVKWEQIHRGMKKITFCIVFALFGATGYAQTVPPKESPAQEKNIIPYPQPVETKKTTQTVPDKKSIQQIRDIRNMLRDQMDQIRNNVA